MGQKQIVFITNLANICDFPNENEIKPYKKAFYSIMYFPTKYVRIFLISSPIHLVVLF